MQYQLRVRMMNRIADSRQQTQRLFEGSTNRIQINRRAIDIVHCDIGDPVRCDPAVEDPCDAGMLHLRQAAALIVKACGAPRPAGLHQLDGDRLLIDAVIAPGAPDLAHAAAANKGLQSPWTDPDVRGADIANGFRIAR